jgi:putative ABC transport system permease protein
MMMTWLCGLLRYRGKPLAAAAAGVALAVALLAVLGLFVSHSASTMTARAIFAVAPDWQIQLTGTTDVSTAMDALPQTVKDPKIQIVDMADVKSLAAATGGTEQATGPGKVVGLDMSYFTMFPRQARLLAGSFDGPLLAQQTAANLHAGPGDIVTVDRLGQPPLPVKIAGLVEMPSADQFFQIIGTAPQSVPNAPPDNVLLLPSPQWNDAFGSQLEAMPQTAQRQLHVSFDHSALPGDPVQAFVEATGAANNLLAKLAGEGVIANNLAARLDGVRQDALFVKVLFLFLGVPGAVVAVLLTMLLVLSGADRRRQEIALMQLRGLESIRMLALTGMEAALVGIGGGIAGILISKLIASALLDIPSGYSEAGWYELAAAAGLFAALAVFCVPAAAALRRRAGENFLETHSVSHAEPAWKRLWLDIVFLALAALVLWQSAATGYRVVAAPEGVATATVDYKAYIAPGFLWLGSALLLMRLWSSLMKHGKAALQAALQPVAKLFSGVVSAGMSRERARITQGVVLVALAFSFAASTAIFNTTYEKQAGVDASLTNGADVAVTGSIDAPASPFLHALATMPGVAHAETMQHRFAYVGTDLQDLYGIDPATIGMATPMSNAYFANDDAAATLAKLEATPDGVLVSDETVSDFQLSVGDKINLRLRNAKDNAYRTVPFTFIGVAREFPTAPSDSFLVANASYVASQTGIATAETILVKSRIAPAELAEKIRGGLPANAALKVTDVSEAVHRIGSSLVAVDLHDLTRLELGFAIPVVAGAVGLVFALGLAERRRTFAILSALGANRRQLGAFLWSEALVIFVVGMAAGFAIGALLAWVLVKLMTHVFDPPPDALAVPWSYLALLALAGLIAVSASVLIQLRKPSEPLSFLIRNV